MRNAGEISAVTRSTGQARRTYNRLAHWYDLIAGASEGRLVTEGVERLSLQPGERVLEIGCGTGRGLVLIAKGVGMEGRVHGIDLSEGMVDVARARVNEAGLEDRVELRQGDGRQLPYGGGTFDAVFMSFTLELFDTPDIPTVLKECRRVLRTRGRLGVVSLSRESRIDTAVRLYEWLHSKLPTLVDCRPIMTRSLIGRAGFEIVSEIHRSMVGLPVGIVTAKVATS